MSGPTYDAQGRIVSESAGRYVSDKDKVKDALEAFLTAKQRLADMEPIASALDDDDDLDGEIDEVTDAPYEAVFEEIANTKSHLHSLLDGQVVQIKRGRDSLVLIPGKRGGVKVRTIGRSFY